MQVCTSLKTDNHASIPPLFFTVWVPFLLPNQQRESTEGSTAKYFLKKTMNSGYNGAHTVLPRRCQL